MPEEPAQPVESFEASLDELEKVVKELEAGDLPLERSLELFEKGMALSETCRKQLEERRNARRNADPQRGQAASRAIPSRQSMTLPRVPGPAAAAHRRETRAPGSRRKPRRPKPFTAPCATACSRAASASVRFCAWQRRDAVSDSPRRNRDGGLLARVDPHLFADPRRSAGAR